MLVAESFFTLMFSLLIILVIIYLVKCRKQILDWINRPPKPDVNMTDMKDLAVLKKYGIENAVEIVKTQQAIKRSEMEALRIYPDKTDKPETLD